MLEAAQRSLFAEHGFLACRRIYTPLEVKRLQLAVEEVLARPGGPVDRDGKPVLLNVTALAGTTTPVVREIAHLHDEFRRHVFNPVIAEMASELLESDELRLVTDQLAVKDPHVSGTIHWHQDYSSFQLEPATQVTCWTTLDDVTADSGGLEYVPGSHRLGEYAPVNLATGRANPADPTPCVPADPTAEGHETVAVELQAGDCVFHHALTWHTSKPNVGNHSRRALITRFAAKGTVFRPKRYAMHPALGSSLQIGKPIDCDDHYPLVWPLRR